MTLILKSTYSPPFLFSNGHIQSIYPTLFRNIKGVHYVRERIETPDFDFIDLGGDNLNSKTNPRKFSTGSNFMQRFKRLSWIRTNFK